MQRITDISISLNTIQLLCPFAAKTSAKTGRQCYMLMIHFGLNDKKSRLLQKPLRRHRLNLPLIIIIKA